MYKILKIQALLIIFITIFNGCSNITTPNTPVQNMKIEEGFIKYGNFVLKVPLDNKNHKIIPTTKELVDIRDRTYTIGKKGIYTIQGLFENLYFDKKYIVNKLHITPGKCYNKNDNIQQTVEKTMEIPFELFFSGIKNLVGSNVNIGHFTYRELLVQNDNESHTVILSNSESNKCDIVVNLPFYTSSDKIRIKHVSWYGGSSRKLKIDDRSMGLYSLSGYSDVEFKNIVLHNFKINSKEDNERLLHQVIKNNYGYIKSLRKEKSKLNLNSDSLLHYPDDADLLYITNNLTTVNSFDEYKTESGKIKKLKNIKHHQMQDISIKKLTIYSDVAIKKSINTDEKVNILNLQ